jgi:uncharacterized protein (TIGR02147 family)
MEKAPHVYNYLDYRAFLRATLLFLQKKNAAFSAGAFARKLGLSDTSSLTKILNGQRHPSDQLATIIADSLKLSEDEKDYLLNLIDLQKVDSSSRMKSLLLQKIAEKKKGLPIKVVDQRYFNVFSHWWFLPIREMFGLKDRMINFSWFKKRLRGEISFEQWQEAMSDLEELGMLVKNHDGQYLRGDKIFDSANDVTQMAVRLHHSEYLELGKKALSEVDLELREFQSLCLSINSSDLPIIKKFIRDFKSKFSSSFGQEYGDEVYQLHIQFFPLTKSSEGEDL